MFDHEALVRNFRAAGSESAKLFAAFTAAAAPKHVADGRTNMPLLRQAGIRNPAVHGGAAPAALEAIPIGDRPMKTDGKPRAAQGQDVHDAEKARMRLCLEAQHPEWTTDDVIQRLEKLLARRRAKAIK